ncbi:TPA: hypothetical protein KQG29_002720 [Clostridioides difficile]|nr:hypothetical protein [Clostridioides difficile]
MFVFQKDLSKKEFEDIIEYLNNEKQKEFLNFNLDYDTIFRFNEEIAGKVKDSIITAKQISAVLANGLNGNPRQCKRFLNSLYMRMEMAKCKQQNLDRKVLAKIMMLKYFKLPLFKKVAELVQSYEGCSSKLKELEDDKVSENDDKVSENNELKVWKDDNWVKQWAMNEPKVSDIDLKPYFYFARTSLDEILEILERWKTENKGLEAAIDKVLKGGK